MRKPYERTLPPLSESERIYLDVPYLRRGFAKACHCRFDPEKKRWFTGSLNRMLPILIETYGIDKEHTSELALASIETAGEGRGEDKQDLDGCEGRPSTR